MHTFLSWRVALAALLACCAALGAACSSEITEADLDKWTRNENGFRRLGELMADGEVTNTIKTNALVKVVDSGQSGRLRSLYDALPNPGPVAKEVAETLIGKLGSNEHASERSKDGLMASLRYLDAEMAERARQRVAEWAFEGLSDSSSTAQIKKQIEHRILPAQIEELGPHGARGAALLLSRGFAIEKMFEFLMGMDDPKVHRMALQALIQLHTIPEVKITYSHLERVARVGNADAVIYLLRVYDTAEDRDIAADAFNRALALLGTEALQSERDRILPSLAVYLEGKNPDDRWFAAGTTVQLSGPDALPHVIRRLRDDAVYDTGSRDALSSALSFCNTSIRSISRVPVGDLVSLAKNGNRVARATAILCLKVAAKSDAIEPLTAMSEDATDLTDFLGTPATIGSLALNAIAGIRYVQKLDGAREAGTLSAADYETKREVALITVDRTGEAFDAEVERTVKTNRR